MPERRSGQRDVHHSRRHFGSHKVPLEREKQKLKKKREKKKNQKTNRVKLLLITLYISNYSSETGHVLTIMKAGDFFGEIGILNLDGLNKYVV